MFLLISSCTEMVTTQTKQSITMTSHECHGVSNCPKIGGLINNEKKHHRRSLVLCEWNTPVDGESTWIVWNHLTFCGVCRFNSPTYKIRQPQGHDMSTKTDRNGYIFISKCSVNIAKPDYVYIVHMWACLIYQVFICNKDTGWTMFPQVWNRVALPLSCALQWCRMGAILSPINDNSTVS